VAPAPLLVKHLDGRETALRAGQRWLVTEEPVLLLSSAPAGGTAR
jgi:hypothetical protein